MAVNPKQENVNQKINVGCHKSLALTKYIIIVPKRTTHLWENQQCVSII